MDTSPLTAAHDLVAAADRLTLKNDYIKAAEKHTEAADKFAVASKSFTDPEALRTLGLLSESHRRLAADVVVRSKAPKGPPLVPRGSQSQGQAQPSSTASAPSPAPPAGPSNSIARTLAAARGAPVSPLHPPPRAAQPAIDPSASNLTPAATFDGSFVDPTDLTTPTEATSGQDAFERFWTVVESMSQTLGNGPLAFTTAPLDGIPTGGVDVSAESFYVVPGTNTPRVEKGKRTVEEYAEENVQLKHVLDTLAKKLGAYERGAGEQQQVLKSSILALKAAMPMPSASTMGSTASLVSHVSISQPGRRHTTDTVDGGQGRTASAREAALEEEVKKLKEELERQRVLREKYERRWDRLKEGARKKVKERGGEK
ncbi:hypothetical protein SAICODRAFT_23903 [Saitoella complicata NRRL Y-17804]|uniref:uncharacterized protein n=1 Tax=Saitoella complicata (strain BCRC 22490 / CBS 7301 / JCM 7358 / NBRC 10748 / NRRL Y-17804) TaxID=698492 RepID=UPI00086766D3|nr:uncharacterized protein SAICODRAFT_23903 [Saitoella complicata NRRL Y-17804]ODQ54640.1 hypothetical protein SAICODRAFT_23903 [Saitoella complicata NRRL Y-17804]